MERTLILIVFAREWVDVIPGIVREIIKFLFFNACVLYQKSFDHKLVFLFKKSLLARKAILKI